MKNINNGTMNRQHYKQHRNLLGKSSFTLRALQLAFTGMKFGVSITVTLVPEQALTVVAFEWQLITVHLRSETTQC